MLKTPNFSTKSDRWHLNFVQKGSIKLQKINENIEAYRKIFVSNIMLGLPQVVKMPNLCVYRHEKRQNTSPFQTLYKYGDHFEVSQEKMSGKVHLIEVLE